MLRLELPSRKSAPLRVLCLGAHSDDIEIGCGGTLLHLLRRRGGAALDWVVFSGSVARAREGRASARRIGREAASLRVVTHRFRDGFFPSQAARIKEAFEALKRRPSPDVVFAPWRGDAHQDHRLLAELAGNTFRDHLVLEYEIAKYDGDLVTPNTYVPLSRELCREKIAHLRAAFPSQAGNQWFDDEAFWALLRLRGIESNSPTRFAEGFHCRKLVLEAGREESPPNRKPLPRSAGDGSVRAIGASAISPSSGPPRTPRRRAGGRRSS
jgi:LmbE family N-acetylglucosaminyl deacetylase